LPQQRDQFAVAEDIQGGGLHRDQTQISLSDGSSGHLTLHGWAIHKDQLMLHPEAGELVLEDSRGSQLQAVEGDIVGEVEPFGHGGLRVRVYQQDPSAKVVLHGKRPGQVPGDRGLADAAFGVRNRHDPCSISAHASLGRCRVMNASVHVRRPNRAVNSLEL